RDTAGARFCRVGRVFEVPPSSRGSWRAGTSLSLVPPYKTRAWHSCDRAAGDTAAEAGGEPGVDRPARAPFGWQPGSGFRTPTRKSTRNLSRAGPTDEPTVRGGAEGNRQLPADPGRAQRRVYRRAEPGDVRRVDPDPHRHP